MKYQEDKVKSLTVGVGCLTLGDGKSYTRGTVFKEGSAAFRVAFSRQIGMTEGETTSKLPLKVVLKPVRKSATVKKKTAQKNISSEDKG